MKILLVTRGSQGDVFPYLAIAECLVKRGHEVTVNLPQIFEETIKPYGFHYVLQAFDDINGLIKDAGDKSEGFRPFLEWTRSIIDKQFEQLPPLLEKHDLLVSTNSEFSIASIAEYCKKPLIRTSYAPLLPSKNIPPATLPFQKPNPIITPGLLWTVLNRFTNFMVKDTINKNRNNIGLPPIKNFGYHSGENSNNFMLYSRYLGSVDKEWPFKWDIGGYCFNDTFQYDKPAYEEMMNFVKSDKTPIVFFTLGSCSAKDGNRFCDMLVRICQRHGYRLIVGSGWAKTGIDLKPNDQLFLQTLPVPHTLIFPHCTGIIHHGGCGTTHSVARAGVPQMITPLLIDQPYWAYRTQQLSIGPGAIKITKATEAEVDKKVCDLVTNPIYKTNATKLAKLIKEENGVKNICDFIEKFQQ